MTTECMHTNRVGVLTSDVKETLGLASQDVFDPAQFETAVSLLSLCA